jgi:transcriptional regulator with XRE-family HTH domain
MLAQPQQFPEISGPFLARFCLTVAATLRIKSHEPWDLSMLFFYSFFWAVCGICLVPKTSGLISEKERQIAVRVRQVRYAKQLSQPEFARVLHETTNRMASIEYARTPLTVGVADKICTKFDVSLIWLAHGRGSMKPCIGRLSSSCPEIGDSTLLSKAMTEEIESQVLKDYDFGWLSAAAILTGGIALPKGKKQQHFVERFHHDFDVLFQKLPHAGREKLLALAVRTLSKFGLDWELGNHQTPGENITMEPRSKVKTGPAVKRGI